MPHSSASLPKCGAYGHLDGEHVPDQHRVGGPLGDDDPGSVAGAGRLFGHTSVFSVADSAICWAARPAAQRSIAPVR